MRNIIIVFICLAALLPGCTATQQQYAITSGKIAVETAMLKDSYAEAEVVIRAKRDVFTDAEWRKLLNVDATVDMLVSRYDALLRLDSAALNISDVSLMWGMAADGYDQAREVITAHWDEFSPSTQILLNSFDKQAQLTSAEINNLLTNPDNAGINSALTLIMGTLSLAAKMLAVGAAVL